MFPTMHTRILNIRASQSDGTVSFSGVFAGYQNAEKTSVSLNVDPAVLEARLAKPVQETPYAELIDESTELAEAM